MGHISPVGLQSDGDTGTVCMCVHICVGGGSWAGGGGVASAGVRECACL